MEDDVAKITITSEDHGETSEVELGLAPLTIGRDDKNALVLKDDLASRRHAVIERTQSGYLFKDVGSSNGTWFKEERLGERLLQDGDELRIGRTRIRFSEPAPAEATIRFDPSMLEQASAAAPPPAAPDAPAPPPPKPAVAPVAPPPPKPAAPPAPAVPPPPKPASPAPPPPAPVVAPPPPIAASSARAPAARAATGEPAEFLPRLLAYLIDAAILTAVSVVIMVPTAVIAGLLGRRVPILALLLSGVGYLLVLAVCIGYPVYFWANRGATPGKKFLKLRVVRVDGVDPIGYAKAFLRLVGYMASGFILYIGFLMILFTERKQGLHDMIAGTLVVRE
jgi:uncharacterized RDD family membrane protein YckC